MKVTIGAILVYDIENGTVAGTVDKPMLGSSIVWDVIDCEWKRRINYRLCLRPHLVERNQSFLADATGEQDIEQL